MSFIGRKREIRKINNFATSEPENKAFFGVKGLGKSSLIETVFTKSNCKSFAEGYRFLFVRTILQSKTKGDDLTNFLLDRVINGIDLIEDEDIRTEIHEKVKNDRDKFHSKDSLLREALETVKEHEYTMILIMDEFHNMGRNTDVGSEQYDFLRSLNELGLVYYWIVSDSDFSDVYATSQFTTSFFAQKFIPETIPQISREDMLEIIKTCADKYDVQVNDDIVADIYGLIGGIPGFVVPAIKCYETMSGQEYDELGLFDLLMEDPKCFSLLNSWSRSLTSEQKDILYDIARRGKVYEDECRNQIGKINQLGDNSGLGLLVHDNDETGRYWCINTRLFEHFILQKNEEFYLADIVVSTSKDNKENSQGPTYVQNIYINNNFFNPNSALEALRNLKQIVSKQEQMILPDQNALSASIQQLPYQQSGWEQLEDTEKEERMDEYADMIFESGDFRADSLSENQMKRFYLSESIMDNLSDISRTNLISAIQVYDLLQFCVDRFGLNMMNSESSRGILFARLYECILKENLTPALNSISLIAAKEIMIPNDKKYLFVDAPVQKMTIGTYVYVLNDKAVQQELGNVCSRDMNRPEFDGVWWRKHQTDMYNVSTLRNDCCHSGNHFDAAKLEKLLSYLFELGNIADVVLYNEITNR